MFVKIMLKRVDEVEAGDIIRSPRDGGHLPFAAWAQVMGVGVQDMATKVTTVRPRTTDGVLSDRRGDRLEFPDRDAVVAKQAAVVVPSWELVEVQTKINISGSARS
jgi:hypothetical protein